ncbi:MAG TPA: hypothetical protein DCR55_00265 [Lentisphaeria bacterium]|nr:hypothetical protein [Lentisphaeria bacterium]
MILAESDTDSRQPWVPAQRYLIGRVIAKDDIWGLYEAEETPSGRTVVVKVCHSKNEAHIERFRTKQNTIALLDHPGVAPIHSTGISPEGEPFYATKFLDGMSMRRVLADLRNGQQSAINGYPLVHLIEAFLKACATIQHAHTHEIVHGALDSHRLLLGPCGELTVTGWGRAEPDAAKTDDIQALGKILYGIVTLQEYVDDFTARGMIQNVVSGRILGPACHNQQLPIAVTVVISASLGLDQTYRYSDVARLIEDIGGFVEGNADSAFTQSVSHPAEVDAPETSYWQLVCACVILILLAAIAQQTYVRHQATAKLHEFQSAVEQVAAERTENAPKFLQKAEEAIVLGELDQALVQLRAALDYSPSMSEAHLLLAQIEAARQNFPGATSAIESCLQVEPGNAAAAALRDSVQALIATDTGQPSADHLERLAALLEAQDQELLARHFTKDIYEKRERAFATFRAAHSEYAARLTVTQPSDRATLDLSGTPIEDLAILRDLPLWQLILDHSNVTDLTPLQTLNLHTLSLRGSKVTDLSPLAGIPLRKLTAAETKVSNIQALRSSQITDLNLADTRVRDLSPLEGLELQMLVLTGAPVSDLRPLANIKLQFLNLGDTSVVDLRPLAGMPLEFLRTSSFVKDLSPLRALPLKQLNISGAKIADLSPLRDMRLNALVANYTNVADLNPLRNHPLHLLRIEGSKVTDLTPILNLPLQTLVFEPERIKVGLQEIRAKKSLRRLGWSQPLVSAAEFWEAFDQGRRIEEAHR